ncbi:SDR family oxidoreductase [Micromonospora mangrovi]|uniref:NAD(P)H-binding protein n=2 Tax=Micromonospora TaxID=1873 RepID=A0AAU7MDW7_9ACTN
MTSTEIPPTGPLTVVVHGATGTQGAPVVRRLLAAGHRVRAAVRDPRRLAATFPTGVQPVAADLLDPDSLRRAYTGADAVVVHLPLVFAGERAVPQAEAVLAALGDAAVPRAVFNTGGPLVPAPVGVPYLDARAVLAARLPDVVPVAAVVGPAGGYLENLSAPWSAPRVAAGELAYPLPAEVPMPWVALDDLADGIAASLTVPAPPARQVIAGPQPLTGDAAAAELSAALGRPVRWRTIGTDEYERMLAPHIGPEAAAGIAGFYAPPPPGAPALPGPDPALITTGPTTLRAWAGRQSWPAGPES